MFENGRRYHVYFGSDKNLQPTDETEQDRLDIHHEIFFHLMDEALHDAPLNNPERILDIGTGTGLWAMDIAEKYPNAEVIGTDLSPIQPKWVPQNCRFEVDDAEKQFTYGENSFDFVHARNIAQGITDWPGLVEQIFYATKPGGFVELAEVGCNIFSDDNTMADDNGIKVYTALLTVAMTKIGRPPMSSVDMKRHLEVAGFVDVVINDYKQPFGPWAKDNKMKRIGAMMLMNAVTGWHAYGMAVFMRILGLPVKEAEKICDDAVKGSRNKNSHTYNFLYALRRRTLMGSMLTVLFIATLFMDASPSAERPFTLFLEFLNFATGWISMFAGMSEIARRFH